jgi:hypothetical protein
MKRSNKSVQKLVLLSPEENSAFVDLAEKRGTDFSELVRKLLHCELRVEQKAASAP